MNDQYDFNLEDVEDQIKEFICPECGCKESGEEILMSKEPPATKNKNPWAGVMQKVVCNDCNMIIPTHLAERWDNLSIEQAKDEWVKLYRKDSKKKNI
jgi:hypothetical protein